jgi:hypothetical protein
MMFDLTHKFRTRLSDLPKEESCAIAVATNFQNAMAFCILDDHTISEHDIYAGVNSDARHQSLVRVYRNTQYNVHRHQTFFPNGLSSHTQPPVLSTLCLFWVPPIRGEVCDEEGRYLEGERY